MLRIILKLLFISLIFTFSSIPVGKTRLTPTESFIGLEPEERMSKSIFEDKETPACVVFRKKRYIQYLLLKSIYGSQLWSPPRGTKRVGSNYSEYAAMLTVEDQTGLEKNDLKLIPDFVKYSRYIVRKIQKDIVYYMAELIDPDKEIRISKEFSEFKWATMQDACELVQHHDKYDLFLACYEHLRKIKYVK